MTDITDFNASELAKHIHERQISCVEVMKAYLDRIEKLNPTFNAIVNLAPAHQLLKQSTECDKLLASGLSKGWLHGIPQAIKDTAHAVGFPSTFGSVVLKNAMPLKDSIMTERMKSAGAIVIGKTNMPELGLGSNTYNDLFGITPNAWDTSVSAGGSSGGAAVAVAQRLLPVADGSDFMGSLRNPAGWNHIFGFRPSQGRVPFGPGSDVWVDQLGVEGPMARTVEDLARLLETQSGYDPLHPLSDRMPLDASSLKYAADNMKGLRIGWLGDLEGYIAMEDGILEICEQSLLSMQNAGACIVPMPLGYDANALWECWLVWRRALIGPKAAALLKQPNANKIIKPEAMWEYEHSIELKYMDFFKASEIRTSFYHHLLKIFETIDVLALPVAQVWPFPKDEDWPKRIGNRKMDTYHRWMECTMYATLSGLPSMSLPAGFHSDKQWPMGIQLIGKPKGDLELLQIAASYEAINKNLLQIRPA